MTISRNLRGLSPDKKGMKDVSKLVYARPQRHRRAEPGLRPRYLVVEDDAAVAAALARFLADSGDGTVEDAMLLLAERSVWSAFFLDVGLPHGSGLDVLARALSLYPSTPAIVLTGDDAPATINGAFDLNADVIAKPFNPRRLEHFLQSSAQSFDSRVECAVSACGSRYALSESERDILLRAVHGERRGVIAHERDTAEITVKAQIRTLLKKTGDDSLHTAVERVLREAAGRPPTPSAVCDHRLQPNCRDVAQCPTPQGLRGNLRVARTKLSAPTSSRLRLFRPHRNVTGLISSADSPLSFVNVAVAACHRSPKAMTRSTSVIELACVREARRRIRSGARIAWGLSIVVGGSSCSSPSSCSRLLVEQFDYAGASDSCTITVTAGAASAQYTFPPPPVGAPDCAVASSGACTVVNGPPATCGRSPTCVAISFSGANAEALHTFLNSGDKPVTTTLQCGTGGPTTKSCDFSCAQGI